MDDEQSPPVETNSSRNILHTRILPNYSDDAGKSLGSVYVLPLFVRSRLRLSPRYLPS